MASASVAIQAGANVRNATPSTIATIYAAAQPGDIVAMEQGSYPQLLGLNKSGLVTIQPQSGAVVSMAGAYFDGTDANTLIRGVRFTSGVLFDNGAHHNTIENCILENLPGDLFEGRCSMNRNAHHNTVRACKFLGNTQCSDGIQIDNAQDNLVEDCEFSGIKQGSCSNHCDAIQLFTGTRTTVRRCYFHDCDTHLMMPDGGDHNIITDNVFVGAGYRPSIQCGHHDGTIIQHNVFVSIDVNYYVAGVDNSPNRNMIVRDNALVGATLNSSGAINTATDHNVSSGIMFVGGQSPTTREGYRLAPNSSGHAAASDGLDVGIR